MFEYPNEWVAGVPNGSMAYTLFTNSSGVKNISEKKCTN